MKKRTMISLIVAAALVVSGGLLLVFGLSYAKGGVSTPVLTERTIPLTEEFGFASVVTTDCDVHIDWVQTWEEARIEFQEYSQTKHTVTVEDEMLKVKLVDHRKWFDRVGIFWSNMQMRIYLPYEQVEYLGVSTTTGDITLEPNVVVSDISLLTDTGAVYSEAQTESLHVETSTGHVGVAACNPDILWVKTDTGHVILSAIEGEKDYDVETSTGKIEAHNVQCGTMRCESNTGDVYLWLVKANDNLQVTTHTGDAYVGNSDTSILSIETTTGDVKIEDSDAEGTTILTDTGNVEGNFRTPKWFQAHSDTGNVAVPHTREGGECRIESNTGDIHFE